MINLTEQLKIAMLKQKVTQTELAHRTNQSQNNLASKMSRNDFKLSEYEKLVTALGCQLEINIILPNGERI
ncbi:MAG: helix-turn-helix domain-containing protein [Clostridia bacterium]|nr:helix-turn-helix domain-containing protein [Clostridia bacterium]MBQ8873482.1 helix-turn-helix domain-containing protein [Clostridia bacterium]